MVEGIEARLKQRAGELGLSLVGITRPQRSAHGAFYRSWLELGAHGDMAYLARADAVARREDPTLTMESVRSIVVVGHEYFSEAGPNLADPSIGVVAGYAQGRDYHTVLKKKLLDLLASIERAADAPVMGRAYVDTGPILERELAVRAGLGWFGKNTMLVNPRRGSWFFLGCLLLDLPLEPDAPFAEDHCGTCTRCLDACPTGALLGRDERGAPVIEARRCISYLTIENRGPIPTELRPLIGNRIYGCDICQEVCPFNQKFATPAKEPDYAPRAATVSPSLVKLMGMSAQEWDEFSRGSAVRRARREGFLRNVAVALGNWGSAEAVPVLVSGLDDPSPLVRGHAAWALGRIGSPDARAALSTRFSIESDDFVVEELRLALAP